MKALTRHDFIDIFPVFRKASDTCITEILSLSRYKAFPRDMQIYSEGDACSAIALILSGEIRVYKIGNRGREITLYEIGPGETCILNASCILSNIPYPAEARAVLDGEMLLIASADFRRMVSAYEEMRDFVFDLLSRRLTSMMALLEEVAFGKMDERLVDYIIEKSENGKLLVTHQKIAGDLGTSREVVSRLLKDLERKGRIRLSRNLIQLVNLSGYPSSL